MKSTCHISQILILKLIKSSKKHFTLCEQCLVCYQLIENLPAGCSKVGVLGVPGGVTRVRAAGNGSQLHFLLGSRSFQ